MWHLLKDMRKKDKGLAFLAVLLIAGQVFLDLKLPDYTKEITVLISSESNTISDYLLSGGKMLACALGSALLAVIVGYLAAKIAADFSHNVRGKVFHKVFDFGAGEISKFSTSSLITRTTNDITQIQMLVAMGLQVMIKAPIMAAWAIVKIVGKSWQLSHQTSPAANTELSSSRYFQSVPYMSLLIPKAKLPMYIYMQAEFYIFPQTESSTIPERKISKK